MDLDCLSLMRVVSKTELGTWAEGEAAETKASARLEPC
jgi:hypothetical protein